MPNSESNKKLIDEAKASRLSRRKKLEHGRNDNAEHEKPDEQDGTRIRGTATGIKEHKRMEGNSQFLSQIAEQVADSAITTNLNFEITWANRSFQELYGYTADEVMGRTPDFLNVEPNSEEIQNDIYQSVSSGEVWRGEVLNKRKDGSKLFCELMVFPLVDEQGKVFAYAGHHRDISERKKAQEEISAERNKLKAMLGAMRSAITIRDLDYTITFQNDITTTIFGDRTGEKCYRAFEGKDEICEGCPVALAFEDGQSHTSVRRVVMPSGEIAFWENTANPIRDADGKIVSCLEICTNITERKMVDEKLCESEDKFAKAFRLGPSLMAITELSDGHIVDMNDGFARALGYSREELIGHCTLELGIWANPEQRDQMIELIRDQRRIDHLEAEVRTMSGELRSMLLSGETIDLNNKPHFISVAIDITEQKRAEERERIATGQLKLSVENMLEGYALHEAIFDENGRMIDFRYLQFNPAAQRIVGVSGEDIIGKTALELFPSIVDGGLMDQYADVMATGEPAHIEDFYYEGDNLNMAFDVSCFRLDEGHFVCIFRDITERKRAEQKILDDREKLKSLASQLSHTEESERHRLATALHDQVGQTLVFSKLKLDLLRNSAPPGELTEALEEVSSCLGQVIDDTRTLTFDLSSPILYELGFEAAVAEWLVDEIQKKHGIEVEFDDDGEPKPLEDDIRVTLFRNVQELLVNIVKHAQAQKVKVCVRRVDEDVQVSVEDDGIGFDSVEIKSTATRSGKFGLFSIRERLEYLGGLVEIESEPGRGSKISMTAPLKCELATDE